MIDIFLHNITWLRKHYGLSKKEMAKKLKKMQNLQNLSQHQMMVAV